MKQKEMKVRITNSEQKKEKLIEQKIDEQGPLRSGSGSGTPAQENGVSQLLGSVVVTGLSGISWSFSGIATWNAQAIPRDPNVPIQEGESHFIVQFISGMLNLSFIGGTHTSIDENNHTVIEEGNSIVIVQPLNYNYNNSGIGSVEITSVYSNISFVKTKTIVIAPGETQVSTTTKNCRVSVRIKITYSQTTHQLENTPLVQPIGIEVT